MAKVFTYSFGTSSFTITTGDNPQSVSVPIGGSYQGYAITGVIGTINGETITGIVGGYPGGTSGVPPGYSQEAYDNTIFINSSNGDDGTSFLGIDYQGIAFTTSGGNTYDLSQQSPFSASGQVHLELDKNGTQVGSVYSASQVTTNYSTVCFASGTLIRTTRGDVAVEALAVDDLVVTASGAHRPIRWIGHRDTDCARHPEPRKVWPVRVASGALGAGLPYADLWLSPGHALYIDEVLIPVRCLIQGNAISQIGREIVTYWHVELDTHDILIANGVAAESYLDTGNRGGFDNAPGAVDLHPDFEPRYTTGFCRPYVESGPLLSAARARLFGATEAASSPAPVHIVADGMVLHGMVGDNEAVFVVPAGARELRLVSPTFQANRPDIRTLGVVVNSLAIECTSRPTRTVALDDPALFAGFHAIERDGPTPWRWTDGDAHFAADLWEGLDGAFLLRIGGMFAARGVERDEDRRAA